MEHFDRYTPVSIRSYGYDYRTGAEFITHPHTHDCWQMNLILAGKCDLETDLWKQPLRPGDALLIPPGCPHTLRPGPKGDFSSYSFKFFLDGEEFGMPGYPVVTEPELRQRQLVWIEALGSIFRSVAPPEVFEVSREFPANSDTPDIELLEGVILGFCRRIGTVEKSAGNPVSSAVRAFVRSRGGKAVGVEECASHLKLSPGHLLFLIRRESGMTTKELIDRERIVLAKRFLTHTDIPISRLATQMEFNTPVYFDRFFKKYTGETPRDCRKRRKYAAIPRL